MSNVRRWYIYLVCAISLQSITWAIIFLLRNLLWFKSQAPAASTAFQIAVIIVGLPLFLVHWLWAQRLSNKEPDERGAFLRRLYLYGMLAAFLAPFTANAFGFASNVFWKAFGVRLSVPFLEGMTLNEAILRDLVAMVILALIWAYHYWIITLDARVVPEKGGSATVRRLYVFGFSGVGLTLTTLAIIHLLRWIMLQFGNIKIVSGGWNDIVVGKEVARLVVGVLLWLVFWAWAGRLFDGPSEEERESALRKFYLYSVIFISAITAVTNATIILAGWFRRLLDLSPSGGDIRNPLPIVIGMALLWVYHAYVLRLDSARVAEARRQAGIRRLYLYLIAAIGLAAFLVGLSGDISVLIRSLSQTSFSNVLKEQLAWFTAALIAGFPVWLLPWRRAQSAAVAQSPEGAEERRSLVRRIYLYFYLFVATMAVLSSAVYIVYQLLSLLLGDRGPRYLMRDIGQAIAFTLIGVGVWLYHGSVLRSDGQINRRERASRLGEWKTTVVDIGESSFGNAVIEGISRVLPGVTPKLIRLPLTVKEDDESSISATQQITETNVIVGPWTIAVAGGSGGMVSAEVANAIQNSPARKLLVPIQAEGWDWAGVDNRNFEALIQQTVHAFRQIVEGEEVKAAKPLGFGASVGIFLGILLLLIMIAIPLIYFFNY